MRVVIQENYDNMSKWTANYIASKIKAHKEDSFPKSTIRATGISCITISSIMSMFRRRTSIS